LTGGIIVIKLKSPLNYRGVLIEKGSVIGYLPVEMQEKLIKTGAAERVILEAVKVEKSAGEKPIDKMTKAELLDLAARLEIPDVSDAMTKAEVINAIVNASQQEGNENAGKADE